MELDWAKGDWKRSGMRGQVRLMIGPEGAGRVGPISNGLIINERAEGACRPLSRAPSRHDVC